MTDPDQPANLQQREPPASGVVGDPNASPLAQAAREAAAAFQRGDWAHAEMRCRQILGDGSDDFYALTMLGILTARTRRVFEAVEMFSRAAAVCPERAEAHSNLGNVLHGLKRSEEALACYDQVLAIAPHDARALSNRGAVLCDLQRYEDALASIDRALAIKPNSAEALNNRGVVLRFLRRYEEALQSHDRALGVRPDYAKALSCRGAVLCDLGRFQEALASYDRALGIDSDFAEALSNRGVALCALGRQSDALQSFDRALAIRPDDAQALSNRGNALAGLKRPEEALACYDRALAIAPRHARTLNNRGAVLRDLQRYEEALASHDGALAIKPKYAEALNGRGVALLDLGRFEEALASCGRALDIKPDYAEALSNCGVALYALSRPDEALRCYDRALAISPDAVGTLVNRGNALSDLKRYGEAIACYERAIAIKPDYANAHWNLSLCSLRLGDFASGAREYEWRWKQELWRGARPAFRKPQWLGTEALDGKTLLLYNEQGLGDTLQFCRYAKRGAKLGANVVLVVQPQLLPLLTGLEGATRVLEAGTELPAFDYHCALPSASLAFKTDVDTIPADIPYVRSNAVRVDVWGEKLGAKTRPRVGLVWSGNPRHLNDRKRSVALAQMLPLAGDWAQWVSLQKDVRATDAGVLASRSDIRHFGEALGDFADTAALVEHMDVVVTVDTSAAHLAGAMGKPTWILLPFNPDWRWLLDREDSPWYPTARLFRQPAIGDWASVIARVRDELARLFGAR